MLRITVHQDDNSNVVLLEGKLIGAWVDELRAAWAKVQSKCRGQTTRVSLTAVSGIDSAGRRLLTEIYSAGGILVGSGLFARALIEEITGVVL